MRKIIGIGETILDIIFKDGQPTAAVPGGSVFNGIISLGRLGQNVTLISETGNDRVGRSIIDFLHANGVDSSSVAVYDEARSAISLAFLNERNDAEYTFYKEYPKARLEVEWPDVQPDDIVMMGSYFVLNPVLRPKVREFLAYVRSRGALIFYDFNFRSSHIHEREAIYADMLENLDYADIVRGSTEDLDNLFGSPDTERVYAEHIAARCPLMISTAAADGVRLITPSVRKVYPVRPIETVSTIGAGDNFNAGIIYGLVRYGIGRADLATLPAAEWDKIIRCGEDLAANVCQSLHNSISTEFARQYREQ